MFTGLIPSFITDSVTNIFVSDSNINKYDYALNVNDRSAPFYPIQLETPNIGASFFVSESSAAKLKKLNETN